MSVNERLAFDFEVKLSGDQAEAGIGTIVFPSAKARYDASIPGRKSSITTLRPASPYIPLTMSSLRTEPASAISFMT